MAEQSKGTKPQSEEVVAQPASSEPKKAWIKPSASLEKVADVTRAGAGNFVKTDGTTCRS